MEQRIYKKENPLNIQHLIPMHAPVVIGGLHQAPVGELLYTSSNMMCDES